MDVRDRQNHEKSTLVSYHAGESIGSGTFSEGIDCTFFNHQLFPDSGHHKRKCLSSRIWYSGTDKHWRCCCHIISFCFEFLVVTVGDITTIFGLFSLGFDQKPCNSCGEKLSVIFGSEVYWGCNQKSLSIKESTQRRNVREQLSNISLTFKRKPQDRCSCSLTRLSGSSSKSTVSRSFLSLLSFTWWMDWSVQITTTGRLTARISTFNHLPDFRPCWILRGSSCQ